ncbi:MAG: chemotaxis-specific protein-glutamate methyltransferase CheB [Myxococcota bacterium]|nr:chemotaxis-specific protein-glutamate methyltransferase CheB [Myxococcota bacterium]
MTLRVLVVDDSAFARKVMRDVLQAAPGIEVVGTARDGLDALAKIQELDPDVMTLDLVMPHLDGLDTLRALSGRERPRVVVVCMAEADSDLALSALEAGALDIVHKPTALATERLYDLSKELVFKVEAAAAARSSGRPARPVSAAAGSSAGVAPIGSPARDLVAIGGSTGGPSAITRLLKALPGDFPVPIAVVVHLPAGFTASFAERLDQECALRVVEATEGVRLTPGKAVIARGDAHLLVQRDARGLYGSLSIEPSSLHRPSVDQLFASAAAAAGERVLAVVLTGMGDDGFEGGQALHRAGASILVESEESCVVYGMPRVVQEAGLASGQFPIDEMAFQISVRVSPGAPP